MRPRSKIDIICDILEVANGGGVTQTRITYDAFLTFLQVKKFMAVLTERNLVQYDRNTRTFKTTEKGIRLLHAYNELGEFMNNKEEE
jgi:predicted transcriptional regulator